MTENVLSLADEVMVDLVHKWTQQLHLLALHLETLGYIQARNHKTIGWLVVLGLTALWDNISVYIGPSPKEREKEEKG